MGNTVIEKEIKDVPPELIIRSLFGMSEAELVQDILKNPSGKWDFLLVG